MKVIGERAGWDGTRRGGCARGWRGCRWGTSAVRRLGVQCGEEEADPRLLTIFWINFVELTTHAKISYSYTRQPSDVFDKEASYGVEKTHEICERERPLMAKDAVPAERGARPTGSGGALVEQKAVREHGRRHERGGHHEQDRLKRGTLGQRVMEKRREETHARARPYGPGAPEKDERGDSA